MKKAIFAFMAVVFLFIFTSKITYAQQITKERILHFPKDYSLGRIIIQDETSVREIVDFHYWIDGTEWKFLAQAQGDVVIPAGMRAQLNVSTTLYRTPEKLAVLEKIEANDLYSLNISAGMETWERPTDAVMIHIAHLKGLRELSLSGANITGKGLSQITGMQQLEELVAPKFVYAGGMKQIAQLKGLKRLYFKASEITNENLKLIAGLKELEELDLFDTNVNDEGLRYLAEFPKLYYLHLNGKFTDEGLKHLKNCSSLRILKVHFPDNNFTDTGLMYISQIKTIEVLWVHWMDKITDKGIEYLAELPNLKKIDLGFAKLTDNACKILQKSRNIECIKFPAKGFGDNASEYLKEIKTLKILNYGAASNSPLADRTLKNLSKLENLEELHVAGKGFTDEGVEYISGLNKLKDLSLFVAPAMTNTGLSRLSKLKNLQKLYLPIESGITIDGLKSLNTLEKLEHLDAACAKKDAILDISGLKSLKDLSISFSRKNAANSSFVDEDLICLKNLVKLEQLRLGKAHIGDNGLKHLKGLTNLYNIFISETEIADEGLKNFYDMKRLDSIGINGSHITDIGLLYLQDLRSLQDIQITTDQNISQKAVSELRKALPSLFRCEIKTEKPQQERAR